MPETADCPGDKVFLELDCVFLLVALFLLVSNDEASSSCHGLLTSCSLLGPPCEARPLLMTFCMKDCVDMVQTKETKTQAAHARKAKPTNTAIYLSTIEVVQVAASRRRPFSSARPCGRRRAIQLFVQRFCRTSIRYSRPTNRPGFDSTTSARTRTRARHTSGRQPLHFYSPVRGASQHGVSAPYCGRLGLCQSVRWSQVWSR